MSSAAVPFWRAAGMTYITYSNICANLVRNCLKEPLKSEALAREKVHYSISKWAEGKPQKPTAHMENDETVVQSPVRGVTENYNDDPLYLQSADHPGLQLVNVKLNGTNFQRWARSVRFALKTKAKLGFVDGKCAQPGINSPAYNQWIRCDSMVVSWLLNSMVPDLSEAFLYVNSAKELWDELTERFGESNGPLLYQLEKDIADLYQGSDSIAVYYTKLKKLWDELSDLSEVLTCESGDSCSAIKKTIEIDQRRKLMQFLMHLNDEYDNIRGQILLLDPLPTVNKAYSMVQRVERQRTVTCGLGGAREIAAFVHKTGTCSPSFGTTEPGPSALMARPLPKGRKDNRKKPKEPRFCDHCQRTGHTIDQCFKIIGYPDWYEGPKEASRDNSSKNKRPLSTAARVAANVVNFDAVQDSPLDEAGGKSPPVYAGKVDEHVIHAVAQEVLRFMRGNQAMDQSHDGSASLTNFAGPYH